MRKINRNDKCPCRSGLKFKKCCQPEMDKRKQDNVVLIRSKYASNATKNPIIQELKNIPAFSPGGSSRG